MPMLFSDDKNIVKCKCGSTLLVEEPISQYTHKTDRNGPYIEKELIRISLSCVVCKTIQIVDLNKHRIIEKPTK